MAINIKFTYNADGLVTAVEEGGTTYTLLHPLEKRMISAKIAGEEPIEISDTEYIIIGG